MPNPTPEERDRETARRIAHQNAKDYDHSLDTISVNLLAEDIEAALSTARRDGEAEAHASLLTSAKELLVLLRDKWACLDADAMTLYLASILAGIAEEWNKNPPENGFTHASDFPCIGRMQIEIRKIDGKSAAESLRDTAKRLEAADLKARAFDWLEANVSDLEAMRHAPGGTVFELAFYVGKKEMSIQRASLLEAIEAAAKDEPK